MRVCCEGPHRIADEDFDVVELESGELLCGEHVDKLSEVRPFDSERDKLNRLKGGGKKPVPQTKFTNSFLFPKT